MVSIQESRTDWIRVLIFAGGNKIKSFGSNSVLIKFPPPTPKLYSGFSSKLVKMVFIPSLSHSIHFDITTYDSFCEVSSLIRKVKLALLVQ